MKATKFRFLTVCLASLLLLLSVAALPSCASRNTAKFSFEIKDAGIEYSQAVGVYYATVTVITTCVRGRLYVKEHPHNVEGGKPWLLDGEIAREGRAEVDALVTELDIRKGDVIEYTWTFDIPRDFAEGDYDIRVEWFGSEQIFHGVCFHSHAEE
jgi:hypothetical protein